MCAGRKCVCAREKCMCATYHPLAEVRFGESAPVFPSEARLVDCRLSGLSCAACSDERLHAKHEKDQADHAHGDLHRRCEWTHRRA